MREPDWNILLAEPSLKLHLYGKEVPLPRRKLGHFTVPGEAGERVFETAMTCRAALGIGDEPLA